MADKRVIAAAISAGLVFGSAALANFIGKWEDGGQKADYVVYADKLAYGLPTGCNGITRYVADVPVVVGDHWSKAQCQAITSRALAKVQGQLIGCFARVPPQSVFDAATSWAWNGGVGPVCRSSAMEAWNRGDWQTGCRRMLISDSGKLQWVYAGGQFVRGVANRRVEEVGGCLLGFPQ